MRLVALAMRDVPEDWRPQLQRLTREDSWAMARWLHQDGSCYASVVFEGDPDDPMDPGLIVGWAVLTFEDGEYPVLGCYVAEHRRGIGYARQACWMLLQLHGSDVQECGGTVCAVSRLWPRYPSMIAAAGFTHLEWE